MSFWDWLFGGSKETHVASSSYNLAGDEAKRPDYLKTVLLQNILSNSKASLADGIRNSYLYGPGIKLRSFFRWCDNNYGVVDMPSGTLSARISINMETVALYIPHGVDETVWAQDGTTGPANYGKWIEQYLLANDPAELENDWTADINEVTREITLTYEDTSVHTFTPTDFDPNSEYLYIYYSLVNAENPQAIVPGSIVDLDPGDPFPSTTGWTLISNVPTSVPYTINTTVHTLVTYSDGRPDEEDEVITPSSGSFTSRVRYYRKDTFMGDIPPIYGIDGVYKTREHMYLYENKEILEDIDVDVTEEDIPADDPGDPDVHVITTVTTTTEYLEDDNSYRIDTQDILITAWNPVQLFIYRIGSGIPDLDDSIQVIGSYGKFFPFLPVRVNNTFLSPSYLPDAYTATKKAYKKLTQNADFDDLISKIASNADLGDIDFAYIVLGVSINVKENECKKYLYEFFGKLQDSQVGGPTVYTNWLLARAGVTNAADGWTLWKEAQSNPSDPLYGTPEPDASSILNPTLTGNSIRITNTGPTATNYDIRLYWNYITSGAGIGLGKVGAKVGELWFTYQGQDLFGSQVPAGNQLGLFSTASIQKIRLWWQRTDNSYTYLDIIGLVHHNYIYDGKFVETLAGDAIQSGTESGMIIPLHYQTLVETNLVSSTQMSTACTFIVFNCYEVVEKPWWQSGFFQIILVVVIAIVIGVATGGAGIGLLGAAGGIGAGLGFTGITAIIVGSVVNALAAVALTSIIGMFANALFGPEIGGIVATVVSFMIMQSVTSFHSTGQFAFNFSELMKVDNLMLIMDAVGKSYSAMINGETAKIKQETQDYLDKGEDELEAIKNKYYEEFGYGIGLLDPLRLTETTRMIVESGDTFLTRTLMTGSEIADMSLAMINDYANLTLNLPNAYS